MKHLTRIKKYSGALDMEEFDYELMNTCLSKYGMQYNNVERVRYWDDENVKWTVTCILHDDKEVDTDND